MSLTYILIDFENVQPEADDLQLIRGANYRVRLFHGPQQNRFDAEIVKALQPLGSQVEYFQSARKGKNALDFHIAFDFGRLVEESAVAKTASKGKSRFFIVSKDSGFDVLIDHVQTLGHDALRVLSVRDALPSARTKKTVAISGTDKKSPKRTPGKAARVSAKGAVAPATKKRAKDEADDPFQRALAILRDRPRNRPTRLKSLEAHLATSLGKGTTSQDVSTVLEKLQREGVVVVTGEKVGYNF